MRVRERGGISTALLCDWKFNREREGGRQEGSRGGKRRRRRRERERERKERRNAKSSKRETLLLELQKSGTDRTARPSLQREVWGCLELVVCVWGGGGGKGERTYSA